jgi:TolB-like protein
LGDVIAQDDDVYGDGVNVAARLEGLAEPGSVVLSGMVHEAVRGKLDYGYENLGSQRVKNIADPIAAFRVRVQNDEGSITDRIISASPPLPNKPSIAVLPFENISGNPEQEFFADGITEDIITALSKISELLVIARNSTFVYKGRAVNVAEVAQELGAGYVLEGSVRTANNRVRITAQLIETGSGHHAWAERYDRELSDIFALQDEITNEIVVALQVNLSEGEQARLHKRQTDSIEAWECYVRGSRDVTSATRAKREQAQELLERAVTLDPNFAVAWVYLCRLHWQDARAHWTSTPEKSLDKAAECVERALAIDDTYPDSHAAIGIVRLFQRRFADAVAAGEKAVELGANSAETYIILAQTLNYVGRAADSAALNERAMRLFPYYPDNLLGVLAVSYRMLGRFEESIALDTERLKRNPDNMYSDHRLASVYMELGREEEARRHVAEAIKKNPHASLRQIRFSEPYQDEEYLERYLDLLRKAGLPE